MNTPSFKPQCPNHGCPLEGCGFPLPAKGTGTCPVSGCPFDFEVETDTSSIKLDKFGRPYMAKGWSVTGDET